MGLYHVDRLGILVFVMCCCVHAVFSVPNGIMF